MSSWRPPPPPPPPPTPYNAMQDLSQPSRRQPPAKYQQVGKTTLNPASVASQYHNLPQINHHQQTQNPQPPAASHVSLNGPQIYGHDYQQQTQQNAQTPMNSGIVSSQEPMPPRPPPPAPNFGNNLQSLSPAPLPPPPQPQTSSQGTNSYPIQQGTLRPPRSPVAGRYAATPQPIIHDEANQFHQQRIFPVPPRPLPPAPPMHGGQMPPPAPTQMIGSSSRRHPEYGQQAPPPLSRPNPYIQSNSQHPMTHSTHQRIEQPQPPLPQAKTKIDPSQIPRPPIFTRPQDGRSAPVYYPKATVTSGAPDTVQPPPAADSRYLVEDDGNASPQLVRSTVYSIPMDRGAWKKCGEVDLALLCNPMALPSEGFVQRPRVVLNQQTDEQYEEDWQDPQAIPVERTALLDRPPRCSRCLAYVNPFWDLDQEKCNLCGARTRTSVLQIAGNALPFQRGTVDFVVGGPYVTRASPVRPVVVYAVDLTCPNIMGHVDVVKDVVFKWSHHYERQVQQQGQCIPIVQVGIVFVGVSGIFVPDPRGGFVVMPDVVEEPFCPLPLSEWTWNLVTSEGRQHFGEFMAWLRDEGQLKKLISHNRQITVGGSSRSCGGGTDTPRRGHALSCGGGALAFLADALSETGGRGVWISWRRPNYGIGAIRDRERGTRDPYGGKQEAYLHKPLQRHPLERLKENPIDEAAAKFYASLGETCAKSCVALDVVLHTDPTVPASFLDLATLGEVCRVSCGRTIWVCQKQCWDQIMREELLRHLLSWSGWNAIFKVRCSAGLQVKKFGANASGVVRDGGLLTNSPELELSVVTPDTRITVELEHRVGGVPKSSNFVYVQSALLYTCIVTGERRVRVSTLALRTATQPADTFRSMDFGTIAAMQLRHIAGSMLQQPNDPSMDYARVTAQSALLERSQRLLANYRMHTKALNSPLGQLILPEKLQLLPLFCTSVIKSPLLRPSLTKRGSGLASVMPSPTADERAFYLWNAATSSPAFAMLMVHPILFSVREFRDGDGDWVSPQQHTRGSRLSNLSSTRYVQLAPTLHPTISNLAADAIYLLDTCFSIYIFIGRNVPEENAQMLEDSFAVGKVVPSSGAIGSPLARFIWQLRAFSSVGGGSESMMRPTYSPIVIVRDTSDHDGEPSRDVIRWMVCDATSHEKDYVDFLCELHRQIRSRVDAG